MNNYQMLIKSMTIEKMAEVFTNGDWRSDEDGYEECYYCNHTGTWHDYDDAIKNEIEWLLEEAK